ncbi:MAG TPA: class I SAM-dependent rRNA methyltransferase [Blastocatellia bacterium]|nr:class I SAM-dependent rRNA methyltransferase [Blastocatellia bacterium]
MATTVTITKRGIERVRARHCWIYSSDVADRGGAQPGEVVCVTDSRSRVLGHALYSSTSQITLRMVSFDDVEVNRDFWLSRLITAEKLRNEVVRDTTAFRMIYGESDLLPSLIIDRYGDCFVIQTLSQGMDALKQMWIELLVERFSPRAIVERNEARVRDLEGLPRLAGVVYGSKPDEFVVFEDGVQLGIDLVDGQKTGSFLDQRENRVAAGRYARGRALDCFTYQGAFALHMSRAAERVIAVDVSAPALARATKNAELNGATNIDFIEANAFDWLREQEQAGERFDVINLDPPAFAKNRASIEAATRGYKELNLRAMKLLVSGGTLITSTCSYHMSEESFLNVIAAAASDAGRSVQLIEKRMQARDHPVLISMPETHYLKCMILRVG